jgi:hypothetical protein
LAVAMAASCSYYYSNGDDDDVPAPLTDAFVRPDACDLPTLPAGCMANAFAAQMPDGEWHMTGSATTTVCGQTGGCGSGTTTTTSTIDKAVFIQRYGCFAGFGSAPMPAADSRTDVSETGISMTCDHIVGCPRGASRWSLCVRYDGELHYEEYTYATSTMPGAYQTTYTVSAVLTR